MLSGFALALASKSDFSDREIAKARLCLQDFLSCAYATNNFNWVRQAQDVARANSATRESGAPLLGTAYRVSVLDAAFANAVAGHSLVRDDMHLGSVSHLGVVVVPAVLALAEQEAVSGRQVLEAIICGYEAAGKLGSMLMDVNTAKKIRPTGLIGAFAAAAAGARMAGLDTTQTANALGFAANYITGLNEWAAWGSDDMYFHPGIAVRNGLSAMQLARAGASSANGSLDGNAGLFSALDKAVPSAPGLPFCQEAEILQVFFKQVPACNYAQTAAQAALELGLEHALDSALLSEISVAVPHAAVHYPGCDYPGPFSSILQARMSIHFNVASALLNGNFDDAHYQDYANADVLALCKRIHVMEDKALTAGYPGKQGATVTATVGGESISTSLEDVLPASDSEVEQRFYDAAQKVLGNEKADALSAAIGVLENAHSLEKLLQNLQ